MVKPDELGRPDESLREQMRKLELTSEEGEDTCTHTPPVQKTNSLLLLFMRYCGADCLLFSHYRNWGWTPDPEHCH